VTGTTTPGRTPPLQSGDDLTARIFRALYADFDLRTVDGVHVAVPKGVACFTGRSLGEIARQISDYENPHEDMAPDSREAAAPARALMRVVLLRPWSHVGPAVRDGEHDALLAEQGNGAADGVPADAVGLAERAFRRHRVKMLQLAALDHPAQDTR
jgi:hypothetical protein